MIYIVLSGLKFNLIQYTFWKNHELYALGDLKKNKISPFLV